MHNLVYMNLLFILSMNDSLEIVPTVPTRCLALFTHANAEVRHAVR